jgi:hypothetical protein
MLWHLVADFLRAFAALSESPDDIRGKPALGSSARFVLLKRD